MTQRIGTDNEQFGIKLLEDDDGSIVEDIKGDGLHKIPLITLEIVRMWLRGIGKKPVTWATLVGVLEKIKLRSLATEIRESPQVKLGIVLQWNLRIMDMRILSIVQRLPLLRR